MKRFDQTTSFHEDQNLNKLLMQRKAPLSPEGMQLALTDLTMYLTGDVFFIGSVFPKKEVIGASEIQAADIEKADVMLGTDNERYFPVFTSIEKFEQFKPKTQHFESIYLMDKLDLLDFLDHNEKISACVLNPGEDDLLLYRMQLQNMIQLGNQR